ncbi:30S ribosome-binding factor RbfA [Candidatus Sumerlaeota bacterium]|nr:30S ribosome-binding factor RbfA [Candidatus Sumerlaeota bacterium]
MLHSRLKRVEELLGQELAKILNYDLRDPRITLVSVTGVKVSRDLSEAVVHVSLLDDAPEKVRDAMEALESARSYVKRLLAERVSLKRHPDIHFKHDPSTSEAFHVFKILEEIQREDAARDILEDEGPAREAGPPNENNDTP